MKAAGSWEQIPVRGGSDPAVRLAFGRRRPASSRRETGMEAGLCRGMCAHGESFGGRSPPKWGSDSQRPPIAPGMRTVLPPWDAASSGGLFLRCRASCSVKPFSNASDRSCLQRATRGGGPLGSTQTGTRNRIIDRFVGCSRRAALACEPPPPNGEDSPHGTVRWPRPIRRHCCPSTKTI